MNEFACPEGKTAYQILNEYEEKTTITLDKWVADILQLELDDVHNWVQLAYDRVQQSKPYIGRKRRGNYVRRIAVVTANKYQTTKREILGWNDQDQEESI